MTNPLNYSGVTINITSPTVNACSGNALPRPNVQIEGEKAVVPCYLPNGQVYYQPQERQVQQVYPQTYMTNPVQAEGNESGGANGVNNKPDNISEQYPQAYPAEYYINNYNQIQQPQQQAVPQAQPQISQQPQQQVYQQPQPQATQQPQPQEVQQSQQQINYQNDCYDENQKTADTIVNNLDERMVQEKANEQKVKQKKVTALTDEYIMSLENYLNNPDNEIRIMAAKEVLGRLGEDSNRYDDAALNALLNKMLQDPSKIVRIAALSALSSEIASGNDYTVKLLKDIENNPNSDKEDVLEASNILLKMSSSKEVRYVPVEETTDTKDRQVKNA